MYFGDLYERVIDLASSATEHRYYVHSPERVIAVVTRGGPEPGTKYLHTDNLGSVESVTDANGGVAEHRSYKPFGERRSPIWGQPPQGPFTSKTTKGFTGQEEDAELGLVNAKGRMLDPRVGRFLSVDPIVSNVWRGQSLNAYSYVRNNPLAYVDPSGFEPEDGRDHSGAQMRVEIRQDPDGNLGFVGTVLPVASGPGGASGKAAQVGAAAPSNDVDTTGSSAGDAQPLVLPPLDPSLPVYDIPQPAGPGTNDPFGIKPSWLALGYSTPLTLLDELLAGDPAGGRNTFILPFEHGFFHDLSVLFGDDRQVVTLRPSISAYPPPNPKEQALYGVVVGGVVTLGALLTPGPQDDIALTLGGTAERSAAEAGAAKGAADAAQGIRPRPTTVAALETGDGTFTGVSGSSQPLHRRVQNALDAIPPSQRSPFHGRCAEPQCISRALEAGVDPAGGTMTAARVRAHGNPSHGTTIPACSSCTQLQEAFRIRSGQ